MFALGGCTTLATDGKNVALMTSLPILWNEEPDIGSMLRNSDVPPHWARAVLSARGRVRPLDRIANETLRGTDLAVLVQPRALAPQEMVALDRWVRGGGRLLLFADPMLDVHSAYPLGDKRRPQAIAMVDPLLAHWGLDLLFDDEQPEALQVITALGLSIPVSRPGHFEVRGNTCRVETGALIARCRVGQGTAIIVADADMFADPISSPRDSRISALEGLLSLVDKSQ